MNKNLIDDKVKGKVSKSGTLDHVVYCFVISYMVGFVIGVVCIVTSLF